ncbi:hypothetical protein ACJX0J_008615, partial [Zea mays]
TMTYQVNEILDIMLLWLSGMCMHNLKLTWIDGDEINFSSFLHTFWCFSVLEVEGTTDIIWHVLFDLFIQEVPICMFLELGYAITLLFWQPVRKDNVFAFSENLDLIGLALVSEPRGGRKEIYF